MHELTLSVAISPDEFLRYYRGVREVRAQATTGQWVRFPALRLRPFVTAGGVHGTFRLRFDDNGKFVDLSRVG